MSAKTAIQYYIPEDNDELEHPNVFSIEKKASSVTLADIREIFPIPGTYYFRFKRAFKKTWIWYDVTDDSEVVPSFEGSIFIKVTRLPASAMKLTSQKSSIKMEKPTEESKSHNTPKTVRSTPSPTSVDDIFNSVPPILPTPTSTPPTTMGDTFLDFSSPSPTPKTADPFAGLF